MPAKSRPWLQILERAALLLTLFGILVRALLGTGSSSAGRLYLAAILCGITPFAAMFLTYSAVKTGAGRAKRCIVTACVTAAVALASVGVLLTMEQNGLLTAMKFRLSCMMKNFGRPSTTTRCRSTSLILA